MTNRLLLFVLACTLAACTGIPLQSIPRLMRLQGELLEANPAEFMVAIQVDGRVVPPPAAVPVLELAIRPAKAGEFEAIDRKLPMRFSVESAKVPGLAAPGAGRRWLVYSLAPESQAELSRLQALFKRLRAQTAERQGGSVAIGIAQDGMAVRDPALAGTRWESWLQTSRRDGFFELWSGSIADLLKNAKSDEAARAPGAN